VIPSSIGMPMAGASEMYLTGQAEPVTNSDYSI